MAPQPDPEPQKKTSPPPPVLVVGHGLAGLVAAFELSRAGIRSVVVDQENENNVGGQAFWSLGGIFMVDSSYQRRMGVRDSRALAMRDWLGTAAFDREYRRPRRRRRSRAVEGESPAQGEEEEEEEVTTTTKDAAGAAHEDGRDGDDAWPRRWAEAFVDFATNDMEAYVRARGLGFLPFVGWAERGSGTAQGHGNSVPRFHTAWGAGPEVVRVFADPVMRARKKGLVEFRFRHAVDELIVDEAGRAVGVRGRVLADDDSPRGVASSREVKDTFELRGSAVVVTSGGIGGNVEAVKAAWPTDRLGPKVPEFFVTGVPAHVDGRMIGITEKAGARVINRDRMWHYTEGLQNWESIWPNHGIRVLPAPSSLWLDATGKRLPPFLFPGTDTLATLRHICHTGYDYSWFISNQSIVAREFALSGSEQNSDLTNKSVLQFLKQRVLGKKGTVHVQNFVNKGQDFVVRDNLRDLVKGMNELVSIDGRGPPLDYDQIKEVVEARDGQFDNTYSKDAQAMLIHSARTYWPDSRSRVAKPHRLLDPKHGPLIAVRMNLLTRKTLGGIETNLDSNVMRADGTPFPGLYAAGEVAGFGGGGVHGYAALEGTFLGGCIFSGRAAGRAIAKQMGASERPRARL